MLTRLGAFSLSFHNDCSVVLYAYYTLLPTSVVRRKADVLNEVLTRMTIMRRLADIRLENWSSSSLHDDAATKTKT